MMKPHINIKRIYDPPAKDDGVRILVDRVWPRGKKKEDLHMDAWWKDMAPSTELRKWFNHDLDKWEVFCESYEEELTANRKDVESELQPLLKNHPKTITLLYSAHDTEHNQAIVLRDFLQKLINKH
ncbi:DUF488 domain-containing protein [Saccharophagus sp. K07]|jgi:uncharacterized protein YeaO (DUF488 family)|uniref:DUF488 domain-containing protein n=1 Tax=Saccharophagus sp. K07 TaxID=2283636 RepID=UPI0021080601|nr:DUF488 family protein [Saccharophagus sp. K07]